MEIWVQAAEAVRQERQIAALTDNHPIRIRTKQSQYWILSAVIWSQYLNKP